jgi:putative transcriptional regulator
MSLKAYSSLKGHFLMAMPSLSDPNFEHSVTCISEHTSDGAFGVVINRIFDGLTGKEIFEELGIKFDIDPHRIPIHVGGPVHINELFVLHGPPFEGESLLMINHYLALNNSRHILEAIAQGNGPQQYLIALGCAGWGGGQLEQELKQNAWLSLPCAPDILFEVPIKERWKCAMGRLGVDPDLLSEAPGNA